MHWNDVDRNSEISGFLSDDDNSRAITAHKQATLNSAYRSEMPNRAEIGGTVGAEFSAHTFQSFHSLSFHLRTVLLFVTTLGCCDAS
jgi:hypothetical protein